MADRETHATEGTPVPSRPTDPGHPDHPAHPGRERVIRRRVHRFAYVYAAGAVVLVPWIVYLAATLPKRQIDVHYRGAWVGFDLLLITAFTLTAWFAFRLDARILFSSTVCATLLIVDAWFDVTTSHGRGQVIQALAFAVFLEIPAAVFSLYLARMVARRVFERAGLEPPHGFGRRRRPPRA